MDNNNQVSFEVVVKPEKDQRSVFEDGEFLNVSNLDRYRPSKDKSIEVSRKLQNNGISVFHIGEFSISASCTREEFESFFSTRIRDQVKPSSIPEEEDFVFSAPSKDDSWELPKKDGLDNLIERAYIQHEPIFFSGERATPPFWNDKFRLRVPTDIAQLMGASPVHKLGLIGKGVKVVMPDTGFYKHPYFDEQGYNFLAVTAPDAVDHTSDNHGHGTGECANLFATAPGINFIGLKMNNPTLAFKTAIELRPNIITNSWGFDVDHKGTKIPNWLKPLHLSVLDAVSRDITVCFSAGNGHYGFPGSMPEVISVGGAFVDEKLVYSASNYASGFDSTWFPGRRTPDICGLCGPGPTADYIVLPVESSASLEKANGWGVFSGTSAASPMVAGVCALLKQADPSLTPSDLKNILKYTAKDIIKGQNRHGRIASVGPDGATGFGLVNAGRAINAVQ